MSLFAVNRIFIAATIGISVSVLFLSCKHEPVLPDRQVSFATEVLPIFAGNCQQSGCHSNGEKPLTTYKQITKGDLIVPGDPYGSEIYQRITSQLKEEVMPVPPQAPLADSQIQTIFIWIKQGAKDN